jgi:hypothetical protein
MKTSTLIETIILGLAIGYAGSVYADQPATKKEPAKTGTHSTKKAGVKAAPVKLDTIEVYDVVQPSIKRDGSIVGLNAYRDVTTTVYDSVSEESQEETETNIVTVLADCGTPMGAVGYKSNLGTILQDSSATVKFVGNWEQGKKDKTFVATQMQTPDGQGYMPVK